MKYVIYKTLSGYCLTNIENYNNAICNLNKVTKLYDFSTPDEIIEYYNKYFGTKTEDFIIE